MILLFQLQKWGNQIQRFLKRYRRSNDRPRFLISGYDPTPETYIFLHITTTANTTTVTTLSTGDANMLEAELFWVGFELGVASAVGVPEPLVEGELGGASETLGEGEVVGAPEPAHNKHLNINNQSLYTF